MVEDPNSKASNDEQIQLCPGIRPISSVNIYCATVDILNTTPRRCQKKTLTQVERDGANDDVEGRGLIDEIVEYAAERVADQHAQRDAAHDQAHHFAAPRVRHVLLVGDQAHT